MKRIGIYLLGIIVLVLAMLPATAIPVSAASLTLRPNGVGTYTQISSQYPTSGAHWDKVDETTPDDGSTYVYTANDSEQLDSYTLTDHTTQTGTINSVTVHFRVRRTDTTSYSRAYFRPFLRLYTAENYGTTVEVNSTSWANYSQTLARPGGGSWSWTDIDSLRVGIGLSDSSSDPARQAQCTQVYVVVDYTANVTNPPLADSCGIDIVLVMDESTSIDSTEFADMQDAFEGFVDALEGTPTQYALVVFGTNAAVQLGWTESTTTIKNAINASRYYSGSGQYTNWEQALIVAHSLFPNRAEKPDLIIFASDGDPTACGGTGTGSTLQTGVSASVALPPAVTAANAIKSDIIRINTIGIGSSVTSANLIAISSADAYYPASNFEALASVLEEIACELCGGNIIINKVIDADGNLGTTDDQTSGGAGWEYSFAITDGTPTSGTRTTNGSGVTDPFEIDIPGSTATAAVTETVQGGYELFAVESSGATSAGSFNGTDGITGIVISPLDIVTVTFYNTPAPADCTIILSNDAVCENTTGLTASVPDAGTGASYTWGVSGDGQITSGQGTRTLTFRANDYNTGTITVNVHVENGGGSTCDSSASVTVYDTPNVNFSASSTSGCAPLTVNFTDLTVGLHPDSTYYWTFGDGGTSTEKNPSHQYTSAGSYTVSLTIENSCGQDTETKNGYITVYGVPVANFIFNPAGGCSLPLEVQFTDTSTNNPTSWSWSFGDGGTSTEQNPIHTYESADEFTVTLTATNACGSNTKIKVDCISTIECPVCQICESGNCVPDTEQNGDVCDTGYTEEEWVFYCDIETGVLWKHQQRHDFYCNNGECIEYLSWDNETQVEDCDIQTGWYDTGETRWVDATNPCQEKEQKEQEYREYYCDETEEDCLYDVTGSTQWVDTGSTRNKPDNTQCGEDYTEETWFFYCDAGTGTLRKHQQHHDFYCEGGQCTDHTSWVNDTLVEDCDDQTGWYDTGSDTQWVDSDNPCQEKEQKEQEYREYYCDETEEGCLYDVTGETQWVDTGEFRNKPDGTQCGECSQCVEGVCTQITTEISCDDGIDNDCDGLIDCDDPDCADFEACGPIADAGPDQTINTGGSAPAGGSPTGSGGLPDLTYSWTPTDGVSDPTVPNPTMTPGSTTTYTVTVCDSLGRCATDSMTVTVKGGGGGGGGGGGIGSPECFMIIDMLGERTTVQMDCINNTTLEHAKAYDFDKKYLLELRDDTEVLCGDCEGYSCYPRIIVMSPSQETLSAPAGMAVVGPIYDFTGYKDTRRQVKCHLVTYFDPSASIALDYDPALLPEGASDPVIAFYSHDRGRWVILPPDTGRVAEVGVATGMADYLASPFAVLVNIPEPTPPPPPVLGPAHFTTSGLVITPTKVDSGDTVTISVNITNDGEQAGTYNAQLQINGSLVNSQNVTLDAGQTETVSFSYTETESGRYEAMLGGLSGVFNVIKPFNWWIIVIIGGALLLGALGYRYRKAIMALFKRRRRRKKPAYGLEEPTPYVEPEAGAYPETEARPGTYPYPVPGMGFDVQPAPQSEVDIYPYPYPTQGLESEPRPSSGPEANLHPDSAPSAKPETSPSAPEVGILFPYPVELESESRPSTEPEANLPSPPPTAAGPEIETQPAPELEADTRPSAEAEAGLQQPQPIAGPEVETQPTTEPEAKVNTRPSPKTRTGTLPFTLPYLYPSPELEAETLPSPDEEVSLYPYLYPSPALEAEIQSEPETEVETFEPEPEVKTQPEPEAEAKPVTELETNPLYPYPYPAAGTEADVLPEPGPEDIVEPENVKPEPAPDANPYLYPYPYPAAGMEDDGPTDT